MFLLVCRGLSCGIRSLFDTKEDFRQGPFISTECIRRVDLREGKEESHDISHVSVVMITL